MPRVKVLAIQACHFQVLAQGTRSWLWHSILNPRAGSGRDHRSLLASQPHP